MYFDKYDGYAMLLAGICITSFVILPCTVASCDLNYRKENIVNWDDIKNSYVGLINDDGEYSTNLLRDCNNGFYKDIINSDIYNKNDIVECHEAVPYFVQTDNVKSSYTKEELSSIIKKFKIGSDEYEYSEDYVKVMK